MIGIGTYIKHVIEGFIHHIDVIDGEFRDTIEPVLLRIYDTVVVRVRHLEIGIDEHLHRLREVLVPLAHAALLHGLFELLHRDLTVLQQVLEFWTDSLDFLKDCLRPISVIEKNDL